MTRHDDRGQAIPLGLAVIVLAIMAVIAMAGLGRFVVDAGRARTAADAAALAGVDGGRSRSARIAADNGAELLSYRRDGTTEGVTVTVTVRVGRSTATAAASNRGP